jgi:phytoene dehydrogenase-like protein
MNMFNTTSKKSPLTAASAGQGKQNIIIIGGGISGLSAGCYARMNGFEATIIEMHDKPGGCCTSWERRDYTFDPCISWLNGSGNDSNDELSQVWRELNTFDGKKISQVSIFNTVRFPDGTDVQFHCDPDILEAHLLTISPQDEIHIKKYCQYVRDFRKCGRHFPFLKAEGLRNFWDKSRVMLKLLPFMKTFSQTMSTSVEQFAAQFQHPKLREAFRYVLFDAVKGLPLLPSCINVANAADNNAGVPAEGSLSVARSLEERFLQLGGEIRYKNQVKMIAVENDRVTGVTLSNGDSLAADIVLSLIHI